jgi:hypothetical protein
MAMTLVVGLALLAAVGGLAVLLVVLQPRRFASRTHGFRLTLLLAVAGAGLLTAWVLGVWGYQASQRVQDPWDRRAVLFREPPHGRAPLECAMAAHLIAVVDVGRQCPP